MPTFDAPIRVISTDPGIDDALALVFLEHFLSPPADYVVATGGNVPARLAANNCAFLKDHFGLRASLFMGSDPPPTGGAGDATHVHGPWGLGRHRSPDASLPPLGELIGILRQDGREMDLLVLGPATDAARLLEDPQLAGRTRRVTAMGGAFEPRSGRLGNVTPYAEFNVYMEPRAAGSLMQRSDVCRFVPLDATEERLFTAPELLGALTHGSRAQFLADLIQYLLETHRRLGCGDGVYMHDVLAAAVWAGLIGAHWRTARVRQLVPHGERQGMVCSDETAPTSVSYAARVDTGRFLELWRQMAADLD